MSLEGLIIIGVLLGIYFLPAIIASKRGHLDRMAITALNVLLGWTLLFWIIALVWSLTGNVELQQRTPGNG
jgi:hypothetical protein